MKNNFVVLFSLLFLSAFSLAAHAEVVGNIYFSYGKKTLDDKDWDPFEDQKQIGLHFDGGSSEWPIGMSAAFLVSSDEQNLGGGLDSEVVIMEARLGVNKTWHPAPQLHLILGGGLSFIQAEIKTELNSNIFPGAYLTFGDEGIGHWLSGGLYYNIEEHFTVGLRLGISSNDIKFSSDVPKMDAGGSEIAIIIGYSL